MYRTQPSTNHNRENLFPPYPHLTMRRVDPRSISPLTGQRNMRTLKRPIAGAAVIALLGCAPAFADGRSYCGWQQGVYVCQSRYETDYAITTTLCGSGGIDAACSTKTKLKE